MEKFYFRREVLHQSDAKMAGTSATEQSNLLLCIKSNKLGDDGTTYPQSLRVPGHGTLPFIYKL